MKVDFPQPESAATPIMIGVCPSLRALKLLDEGDEARRCAGMKADGVNAAALTKQKAETRNFISNFF